MRSSLERSATRTAVRAQPSAKPEQPMTAKSTAIGARALATASPTRDPSVPRTRPPAPRRRSPTISRAGFLTLLLAELGADPAVVGGLIYSPAGLGIAYAYYLIPQVVPVVLPALINFDMAQVFAARTLGAGALRAYADVLLPQVLPGLLAAFCPTLAVAIGAYGTALALVGTQINILPLVLFSKISETGSDFPAAAALSVMLMGLCCCVIALAEIATKRSVPAKAGA